MRYTPVKKDFKRGYLDQVAKIIRREGNILHTFDSYQEEEGYYQGQYTSFKIDHNNVIWELEMLNGEVLRLGYKH